MLSGIKIRNSTLAISAFLSPILQEFLSRLFETSLSTIQLVSKSLFSILSACSYILIFVLCVALMQLLSKIPWVRVHLFKEKIVEGTWFECIYTDPDMTNKYSYGLVHTFFDNNGEFVYKGDDYALETFSNVGKFISSCSSLKYFSHDHTATLDYAYHFEHENCAERGYGCIDFVVGRNNSNRHHGKFFNSDGKVYYFSAVLITDKKILKALTGGSNAEFRSAMQHLALAFDDDTISQREKINALYELDPGAFHSFCTMEDHDNNLEQTFRRFDFSDKVVLDMGAGTGRFSQLVVEDARHLICSDLSERMLAFLRQSELAQQHGSKMEFVHSDHLNLPCFIDHWMKKVDYIVAGYTIGAYFNDNTMTDAQRVRLFQKVMDTAKSILKDGGTLIITESLGIRDAHGNATLLNHDKQLVHYYSLLDDYGFQRLELDTRFEFDSEPEAYRTIQKFWGTEGAKHITQQGKKWVLNEVSGIWTMTFS